MSRTESPFALKCFRKWVDPVLFGLSDWKSVFIDYFPEQSSYLPYIISTTFFAWR